MRRTTSSAGAFALTLVCLTPTTAFAQDADKLWRDGASAARNGNPQGCIFNLREALRVGGSAYEMWGWLHMTLGMCLAQNKQRDEAISELEIARPLVTEEQEKFNVYNSLAQVYIARGITGDYERAIVAETEAGKYAADARTRGLHSKTLGQAYYFQRDWDNAIRHLEEAAQLRPTDGGLKSQLYLARGEAEKVLTGRASETAPQENSEQSSPSSSSDLSVFTTGEAAGTQETPNVEDLRWLLLAVSQAGQDAWDDGSPLHDFHPTCSEDARLLRPDGEPLDICLREVILPGGTVARPTFIFENGKTWHDEHVQLSVTTEEVVRLTKARDLDAGFFDLPHFGFQYQLRQLSGLARTLFADGRVTELSVIWQRVSEPSFDRFGNQQDAEPVRYGSIRVSRETVSKINWDNFESSNWVYIADEYVPGEIDFRSPDDQEPTEQKSGPADDISPGPTEMTVPAGTPDPATTSSFSGLAHRFTEKNDTWWRLSYRFTVDNRGSERLTGTICARAVDADRFTIDEDRVRVSVAPGQSTEYTGFMLVTMPGARNVTALMVASCQ